jgi:hypothetical protein
VAWARHCGQVHLVTPMQIATGTAFGKLPAKVILAFPGQNHIERWIEHLVQQRAKACVILPDWHGPAMSAVEQAQVARLQLGPAYGVFNASGGREIPGWMMVATLVDFGDDAEVDLPIAGQAGATPTSTAAELTNRFRARFQNGATNVAGHPTADTTQHVGDNTTPTSVAQRLKALLDDKHSMPTGTTSHAATHSVAPQPQSIRVRGKVIHRRVTHHQRAYCSFPPPSRVAPGCRTHPPRYPGTGAKRWHRRPSRSAPSAASAPRGGGRARVQYSFWRIPAQCRCCWLHFTV